MPNRALRTTFFLPVAAQDRRIRPGHALLRSTMAGTPQFTAEEGAIALPGRKSPIDPRVALRGPKGVTCPAPLTTQGHAILPNASSFGGGMLPGTCRMGQCCVGPCILGFAGSGSCAT